MHPSLRYMSLLAATRTFGALVAAQGAHSIEEYVGRLWETFPPTAFVTGLLSSNREVGFVVINIAIVAFGVWCLLWPVRKDWPSAPTLMWCWALIETINGIGHPVWSIAQGGYTPGVLTAPILLATALYLASQLRHFSRPTSRAV